MSGKVSIPPEVWEQVVKTSQECQKTWGMGFPVISITLLKQALKRQQPEKPKKSIYHE